MSRFVAFNLLNVEINNLWKSIIPNDLRDRTRIEITLSKLIDMSNQAFLLQHLMSGWLLDYSYKCQPVDYSHNPSALRMANLCWWYFISKFTEFADTVRFVFMNSHTAHQPVIVTYKACDSISFKNKFLSLNFKKCQGHLLIKSTCV